jgi:hypothetical protein
VRVFVGTAFDFVGGIFFIVDEHFFVGGFEQVYVKFVRQT